MDYLKSLNMEIKFSQPSSASIDRTIQLINKTNQFNTTNLSINTSDINNLKNSKNKFIYLMTLTDNVTDYGIISIIWGNVLSKYIEINNWVMSCRVFNRHLEDLIIYKLFNDFSFKKSEIRFKFNKTVKNKILPDIFLKLGCQLSNKEFIIHKSKFKSKNHKIFKN